MPGDHSHQWFAAVCVQIINNKHPAVGQPRLNQSFDVPGKVFVVSSFFDGWKNELTVHDVPVSGQANRSVPSVLTLFFAALTRLRSFRGSTFFVSLQACHFVDGNRENVLLGQQRRRIEIRLTDVFRLLLKECLILLGGESPTFVLMWLKLNTIQKTLNLRHGNGLHHASENRFVRDFTGRPGRDGPARLFGVFAGD